MNFLKRKLLPMSGPMGGGDSGGGGSSTTTTVAQPAPYVKPYLIDLMERSGELSNQPYQSYGGERIAPMTPEHYAGLDMTTQRALSGSPVMNAAQSNLTDTAQGKYLDISKNPAWGATSQAITDAYGRGTKATTDAAFSRSGAFGGSAWNEATQANQEGLGKALAGAAGDLYNAERTNQMRAAMFAPQMAEADYRDAQALLGVGDIYRDQGQNYLNTAYQDWGSAQQWPYQQLDVLANAIRTSMGSGGSTTTSSPDAMRTNPAAGMIGGGMAGYGVASAFPQSGINPWLGAGGGALLGGLL